MVRITISSTADPRPPGIVIDDVSVIGVQLGNQRRCSATTHSAGSSTTGPRR